MEDRIDSGHKYPVSNKNYDENMMHGPPLNHESSCEYYEKTNLSIFLLQVKIMYI